MSISIRGISVILMLSLVGPAYGMLKTTNLRKPLVTRTAFSQFKLKQPLALPWVKEQRILKIASQSYPLRPEERRGLKINPRFTPPIYLPKNYFYWCPPPCDLK